MVFDLSPALAAKGPIHNTDRGCAASGAFQQRGVVPLGQEGFLNSARNPSLSTPVSWVSDKTHCREVIDIAAHGALAFKGRIQAS